MGTNDSPGTALCAAELLWQVAIEQCRREITSAGSDRQMHPSLIAYRQRLV